jgi:alanine transaminase
MPITFNRQVLACLLDHTLIDLPGINKDAAMRAHRSLHEIISAGSYTHSLGVPMIRSTISQYIAREDNVPPPEQDQIFLIDGASQGVHLLLETMITCP